MTSSTVEPACRAPSTSMYLDPRGNVLACCQNVWEPLGNIGEQTLAEIWWGEAAAALRASTRSLPLPPGCRFCQWHIDEPTAPEPYSRAFDHFSVADPVAWPAQIEFSVSNTCNLRCAMCNGEWSSSIRSRRENLPPLPSVYREAFFEQVTEFLPHLSSARFLGGEPFLARENHRLWDLLIETAPEVACHVTTNATVWNERVEQVLDALPMSVTVSVDGLSHEVFEAIRVGSSHAAVLDNLRRFRQASDRRVDLAFCLMRQNWHEFGDLLAWATSEDLAVYVNTVTHPEFSLFTLDAPELRKVVEGLEAQDDSLSGTLGVNQRVWHDEVNRLRGHLRSVDVGADRLYFAPAELTAGELLAAPAFRPNWTDPGPAAAARATLEDWGGPEAIGWLTIDTAGRIIGAGGEDSFLGLPSAHLIDTPASDLLGSLTSSHGGTAHRLRSEVSDRWEDVLIVLAGDRATFVRLLVWDRIARDGTPRGQVVHAAMDVQSGTDVLTAGYRR